MKNFILLFLCIFLYGINKPVIDIRMDEKAWDNDPNTYEVKNYGTFNSDLSSYDNANTEKNKTVNGGICHVGTFDINNKALLMLNKKYSLPKKYTITVWIKFPLNEKKHKIFTTDSSDDDKEYYKYFNIVDIEGKDDDFIYFKKKLNDNTWHLCISNTCHEFNPNNLTGWHFLTFVADYKSVLFLFKYYTTSFYLDADYKFKIDENIHNKYLTIFFNSDYDTDDNPTNHPNMQSIGNYVDEFKLFDKVLTKNEIKQIYDNEKNKKNYDGSNRICNDNEEDDNDNNTDNDNNQSQKFDVSDIDEDDMIVKTKIVNKNFDVYINSLNDKNESVSFTGKVCYRIYDKKYDLYTNWKKTFFMNEKRKKVSLKIDKSIKKGIFNIRWNKNDIDCKDMTNEVNSSDYFAIRPYKFKLVNNNNKIKAGEYFKITLKVLDYEDNIIKNYNEDISNLKIISKIKKEGCNDGNLTFDSNSKFKNGVLKLKMKQKEVGDFNLTIKEKEGNEFAKVDSNDTNTSDRLIEEVNSTYYVIPYKFDITYKINNRNNDSNFTYLNNKDFEYGLIDLNISVLNKNDDLTENYNKDCYAKDINISIKKEILKNNKKLGGINKILYYFENIENNKSKVNKIDIDKNITIKYDKSNFLKDNKGKTKIKIFINFNRSLSEYTNPFIFNIKNIKINNEDLETNNSIDNKKLKYYYGYLDTNDYFTSKNEINVTSSFLIYDKNETDTLIPKNSKELLYKLWINTYHNIEDTNLSEEDIVVTNNSKLKNKIDKSKIEIKILSIKNGKIKINVKRKDNDINYVVLHFIKDGLYPFWYSKYKEEYKTDEDSSCLNHFCISITFENITNGSVQSGEFNGTRTKIENVKRRLGIKMFR